MSRIPVVLAAFALLTLARPASALEVSLHPLCVQQMVWLDKFHFATEAADALPAKACNEFYKKIPVEIKGQFYSSKFGGIKAKNLPVYEYRIVGYHRNLTVVNLQESVGSADGGASLFSAVAFFSGWPVSESRDANDIGGATSFAGLLEAGDRCNGGIADAKMASASVLRVDERITPYDLFTYRAGRALKRDKDRNFIRTNTSEQIEPVSTKLLMLEPRRDLDAAPVSCIGTATTEYDLESGTSKLTSVTLTGLNDRNAAWVSKHKYQLCFNRVVRASVSSFPATLKPEQVQEMSKAFESQCLIDASN